MRRLCIAALSAAVVAAFTLPLAAGEARSSGNTPFRTGPGEGYPVIGKLVDGRYYEVEDCTREERWCLVSEDGDYLGWVRGSYLVGGAAKTRVTPPSFLFDVHPRFGGFFGD